MIKSSTTSLECQYKNTYEMCNKHEYTTHLIFYCLNNIRVWDQLSIHVSLSKDIPCKHVIVEYKMYSTLKSPKETGTYIHSHFKQSLCSCRKCVKRLHTSVDYKLFDRMAHILWFNISKILTFWTNCFLFCIRICHIKYHVENTYHHLIIYVYPLNTLIL